MAPQTIYPGHRVLDYYASRRHLQSLLRPRRLPTTSLQPTKNAELFAIHGGRLLRWRDLEARRETISPRMPSSAMRPLDETTQGLQAHRAKDFKHIEPRTSSTSSPEMDRNETAEIELGATKPARDRASGRTAICWANNLTYGPLQGSSQAIDCD